MRTMRNSRTATANYVKQTYGIGRDPQSRALQAVCDRCGKHGLVYRWTAANRETLKGWYEFRICPGCFVALQNFFVNGRQKAAAAANDRAAQIELDARLRARDIANRTRETAP